MFSVPSSGYIERRPIIQAFTVDPILEIPAGYEFTHSCQHRLLRLQPEYFLGDVCDSKAWEDI